MTAKRIGRISVARVTDEWADTQALNPRSLAFEMAEALRSMSQPGATVPRDKALVMGVASLDGADELTWHGLADYFDCFGSGNHPARVATLRGECQPSALLLDRAWLEMLTSEAVARAEIAAGYAQALSGTLTTAGATALAPQQPVTLSGSAPECLELREAQQRHKGEGSAAEQLDAALIAREQSEQEANRLRTQVAIVEAQLCQAQEEIEDWRRELSEERRETTKLAERLAESEQAVQIAEQNAAEAVAHTATRFGHLECALKHVTDLVSGPSPKKTTAAQKTALLVIAGLLRLLTAKNRSRYSQGSAASAIADMGWTGAGARNVNAVFSEAKKCAADAAADAQAKAEAIQESNAVDTE
ncbi:MAG: hypothetical protein ACKVLM_22520 [Pseudomonadales bacterium]